MSDETEEFNLHVDKILYEELLIKAKEKGLEISDFISFLVKVAGSQDPPSPSEPTK